MCAYREEGIDYSPLQGEGFESIELSATPEEVKSSSLWEKIEERQGTEKGGVHSAKDWEVDDGDDDELKSLLTPLENGISRSFDRGKRKVQWNDSIGNDLAEVLEFVPSDSNENDDEDSNSCLCTIM